MAWAALAAAAVGAIAGGQKDKKGGYTESNSTNAVDLQDITKLNIGRSQTEAFADSTNLDAFKGLADLLKYGPGANEVGAANTSTNDFANRLQSIFNQGSGPSGAQISEAQKYASDIFAPQREQLRQQFDDMGVQSNRLAARLGRAGNDPILRNKLMQEQSRQSRMLDSQQGAFAAERAGGAQEREANFAMNAGGALMNVRQGLASQAFQNRQALLTMGNQLMQNERMYRVNTATRTGYNHQSGEEWSGGGMKGAVGGAFAGFGAVMGGGGMGGMGGAGGAGG